MTTTKMKIAKAAWLEETILDARSFGHFKVASIMEEVLELLKIDNE
jgi:hypothetical protein